MKKQKYGEDTVVMRVPRSLVPQVKAFLQSSEVLTLTRKTKPKGASPIDDILQEFPVELIQEGLRRAYLRGFQAGEEFCIAEQLELSDQKHKIPMVLKAFRIRSPDVPSDELAAAFMNVRHDWYNLTGSGLNSAFLFPSRSEFEDGLIAEKLLDIAAS